jgi:hypothetical protein
MADVKLGDYWFIAQKLASHGQKSKLMLIII